MEKGSCVPTSQHLLCALTFHPKVTDALHANGSYIFLQLWALGRAADPSVLMQEGGYDFVAAIPIPSEAGPLLEMEN